MFGKGNKAQNLNEGTAASLCVFMLVLKSFF